MNERLRALDQTYIAHTYARFPVDLVRGEGSLAYDGAGKAYIDMGSGIGVTAFGFADPVWCGAVTEQLTKLQHTSNLYYTEPCARLAELLCRRTGMQRVFYSNSGAEANECAVKVARKYASEKKGPQYCAILTLENSFHGRTLTTLAATGQEHYHELFQPLTPGFHHAPAGDLAAVERLLRTYPTAGILIECIQGEGGVVPLDPSFVQGLAKLCEEQDVLLMIDEVQTGNGRTGTLYAYEQFGVRPDVVSTAKGLGGGLPLGATLIGEKAKDVLGFGDHGSTFGGNPVCCAGAYSVLERLDEPFLASVREKSRLAFSMLRDAKGVRSVTGLGLMIGVETVRPAKEVVSVCLEKGVLCLTAKEKVRFLPALNIPTELLQTALERFLSVCADC